MESKLGTHSDKVRGETSGSVIHSQSKSPRKVTGTSRSSLSDVQPDSSDVESSESSDSELEEGEFSRLEPDFELGYTMVGAQCTRHFSQSRLHTVADNWRL
ncbi:hypothetical protein F2Q70_00031981 [Brassica cretica]|uniref:Uncharacterized protein n=1 Tax=Brassica cretica TaxID=69181 RepID=A0A8S9FF49_BRACR|nr:hypothetical protein F2Q70_00031981 [Brassica cretica]